MTSRRRLFTCLAALAMVCFPSLAFAGTASLDSSFSLDGKQRLNDVGPRGSDWVNSLEVVNGNTYVLGTLKRSDGQTGWYLARFLPGGTLDQAFGDAGVAIPPLYGMGGLTPYSFDLFVGDDGSAAVSFQNFHALVITRWTPTGALDQSFSKDGIRDIPVTSNHHFSLSTSITVDSQQRAVVAGTHTFLDSHGYASDMLLFRLRASGSLDSAFSHNGRRVLDYFRRDRPIELTTDRSDRVVVGGSHRSPYRQRGGGFFFRFDQNGTLDTAFSGDGFLSVTYQGAPAYPGDVAVSADGSITSFLATESGGVGGIRLNDDGSRDRLYGDRGVAAVLCSCDRTHAVVDNGRVVLSTERTGHQHVNIIVVNRAGSVIHRYGGVLVPKVRNPYGLDAIAVEGDRVMVGSRWNVPAYIARVMLAA